LLAQIESRVFSFDVSDINLHGKPENPLVVCANRQSMQLGVHNCFDVTDINFAYAKPQLSTCLLSPDRTIAPAIVLG